MDGRFADEGVALVSTAAKTVCVCRTETNRPHVAVQSPYLAVGAISIAMSA